MATYVTAICPNKEKGKCDYYFNSAMRIGESTVQCEGCGEIFHKAPSPVRCRRTVYPYYNFSLGADISSKEHESHIAKEKNMKRVD